MNGQSAHDLEAMGQLLLALHKLPQQVGFTEFQDAALTLLAKTLHFDSAWWGLVSGLNIHTEIRFNLPDTYRDDWEQVKNLDPIAVATSTRPFVTFRINEDGLSGYPELQQMLRPYGIHHVLSTQTREADLGLQAFISVYRKDPPFSEADRLLKQAVMPHLIHALHLSWRKHLETSLFDISGPSPLAASAITDATGLIFSAEELFARFMTVEWPRWRGPILPEPLLHHLKGGGDYRGRKIRIGFRNVSGLILGRVSERRLISELTARELAVAELYAEGLTHKAIARDLNIAPTTARHYIRTVFNKLQIKNKAELTRVIFAETR